MHYNSVVEFERLQNSPSYQALLEEKLNRDRQKELEEKQIHEAREREWLRAEKEAQKVFLELQQKLALAKEERARQNEKIRLEWEEEQKRREELRQQKENELQEQLRQQELSKAKVEDFIEYGGDTPDHLKTTLETNPNKPPCPFFSKTATCRFFDVCSRNHVRPGISKILLIPNFFSHYSLEKTESDRFADAGLEFERHEIKTCYDEFFYDVVPELETFGELGLFVTCCNKESHLRGNVFIEFHSTQAALKCYRGLNGRWYAGRQISVQFVNIPSWNSAVCGVHFSNRCPKGSSCNFLHTFRNPGNSFSVYNKMKKDTEQRQRNHLESRNWRWSESPETSPKEDDWEVDAPRSSRSRVKNGSKRKRRSHSRESERRSRSSRHKKDERRKRKRRDT
ncbi:unnamed protein product [Phyllotreta striolata]|uniref:C3H1-type domain-containing protein n=1 Tax=Phyllotreta striolata TaxID=444603 RepID=A0A9N9TFM8_PHYSR|nr:unnamed protein product [Phyllotreta striolata]